MIRGRNLGANVTAVFLRYDARATVEAALRLRPGTRQIVVVGGASRLDLGYVDVVREDLRDLASPVTATYITKQPLKAVLAVVAALRDDALVLFLSMQSDGDGVARTGLEVLEALRSVAKVPIYGISGNLLGRGIVGGVLFDTQRHESDLAQRARQILSGVPAADLVPMTSPNRPGFDWRELKRFGIDDARLPAGAAVVNRDPGLWDTYKRIVLVAGAVLIGQSLLIGGLLVQRRRRHRAELDLRDLGGRLIVAQEGERARIARELHDDVSQQLAALSIALSGLRRRAAAVANGCGLENDVSSLLLRATTLAESVRALSHDLHPDVLRHVGLGTSLTAYCNSVSRSKALEVTCTAEGDFESLSPDVALCLLQDRPGSAAKRHQARARPLGQGPAAPHRRHRRAHDLGRWRGLRHPKARWRQRNRPGQHYGARPVVERNLERRDHLERGNDGEGPDPNPNAPVERQWLS